MNRQIGWSQESNLLWQIGNQIDRFEKVIFASLSNTVPSSRTLTINGVTYDLSANRTWTVSTGISGTIATGQVAFGSALNTVAGSNNLFWDSANNNLGIGTTAPIGKLDIVSDGGGQMFFTRYGGQPQINIRRSQGTFAAPTAVVSGASSLLNFQNYNGTAFAASAQIQVVPTTQTLTDAGATMALNVVRNGTTTMTNGLLISGNNATVGAISITNAFNGPSSRLTIWGSTINTTLDYFDIVNSGGGQLLRFFNTGNLVVGGSPDSGQRLQVNGDTFLKGTGTTSATSALLVQDGSGADRFKVLNDGVIEISNRLKLNTIAGLSTGTVNIDASFSLLNSVSGSYTRIALGSQSISSSGNFTSTGFRDNVVTNITSTSTLDYTSFLASPTLTALTAGSIYKAFGWTNNTGWGLYGQGTADNFLGGGLLINGVLRETITTNRQTASYTLALADRGKLVEMNVATANNLTVPLDSAVAFPIGSKIDISQYGAGQTTVVATGGVTIRSAGGALKLALQYSGASLVKIATNEWYLFGDITV